MVLLSKQDYLKPMSRVDAWFNREVLDRPPVRFSKHNVEYENHHGHDASRWPTLKHRWMDAEYQLDSFLARMERESFRGETFPVFWPNLGPDIYATFFGCELEFGDITSWSKPLIEDIEDAGQIKSIRFDPDHPYLLKLGELTRMALEKCAGRALVGVTSWCPGIDCVAAWLGPENLCMALITHPDEVRCLAEAALPPFQPLADRFYAMISEKGLPSVGWMGIPNAGKCHIAQTDFANMISPQLFREFCLPSLKREMEGMDKVIFHMDGKGVATHVDELIALEGIDAIQWAQGVGADEPIMQWIPLIRKIQRGGKGVVVDLKPHELEPFMNEVPPEGVFLCIQAEDDIQEDILRKLLKWP